MKKKEVGNTLEKWLLLLTILSLFGFIVDDLTAQSQPIGVRYEGNNYNCTQAKGILITRGIICNNGTHKLSFNRYMEHSKIEEIPLKGKVIKK